MGRSFARADSIPLCGDADRHCDRITEMQMRAKRFCQRLPQVGNGGSLRLTTTDGARNLLHSQKEIAFRTRLGHNGPRESEQALKLRVVFSANPLMTASPRPVRERTSERIDHVDELRRQPRADLLGDRRRNMPVVRLRDTTRDRGLRVAVTPE